MTPQPEAWRRAYEAWDTDRDWLSGTDAREEVFRAGFQSRDAEISELRAAADKLLKCNDDAATAMMECATEEAMLHVAETRGRAFTAALDEFRSAVARHQPAETGKE